MGIKPTFATPGDALSILTNGAQKHAVGYPDPGDVTLGLAYGPQLEFTGTGAAGADYPSEDDVRDGTDYDGGGQTGNMTLPAEEDVRYNVTYGTGGIEYTGTFGNAPPAAGTYPDTFIREFCQWIENNTSRVLGTDLLCGHEETDDGATIDIVLDNGGPTNFYSTDMKDKSLQILSIAPTYMTAHANANELFTLCHGKSGLTMPVITSGEEYIVNTINCLNTPMFLSKREDGRYEFSFNMMLNIQDAP